MLRSSVILISPLLSVTVPLRPAAKWIVSAPGVALASRTAWRREPAPPSARFRTVKLLGTVRSSRDSRRGRMVLVGRTVVLRFGTGLHGCVRVRPRRADRAPGDAGPVRGSLDAGTAPAC